VLGIMFVLPGPRLSSAERSSWAEATTPGPRVTEIVKVPNRGHSLTVHHGWREVAEIALTFVKRFA